MLANNQPQDPENTQPGMIPLESANTDSLSESPFELPTEQEALSEAVRHAESLPEPAVAIAASRPVTLKPPIRPAIRGDSMMACRYELKYRIPETTARAIAQFIKPYLQRDRYAQLRPNGEYPITSLYLDSDRLQLCRETLEGKKNRFKLRIRGYSDKPDTPVFFEIKRRVQNVILKSRARGLHHHVPLILAGHEMPPQNFPTDIKALHQFQLYVKYLNARPMVLVRYMREAYEGDGDSRVRVTFDRQLNYCVTEEPRVRLGGTGWLPVALNFSILEIKFTARYPGWLSEMVRIFDLKVTSMSKYASSIRQSAMTGFSAPRYSQVIQLFA